MAWSFPIGRLFGSELRIHVTFFLLLAWIGFATYTAEGPEAALANVLFVVVLFACVVAHEFGHALTARRYGIRTPDITLLPIGGLARLERMPENPRQEIMVALAGPAVNVVIWAVLTIVFGARLPEQGLESIDLTGGGFLAQVAMVNLFLAVFNLIPAFPMDGGRVLRALLSLWTDRVTATRMAAVAGQIVAFGLGFWGLSSGNPILVLIALFVFVAANAEAQDVAMRSVARRLVARDAMITHFESLAPTDTIATAAMELVRTTQHEFPVLNEDGSLAGFVTRSALFAALASDEPRSRPAYEIMDAAIPQVSLGTGLEEVLELMHNGAPAVAVVDRFGRMAGYITRENVGELMVVRGR
ncbi:site-2 protease family protein [Jhaorihella thermophila]|uniref:Zinc metalloprotease n=1 Tax=Jhaorihella thermophila TaxID=488547 RepID=A0A1H5SFF8_9RHOB|nr:site-2 protease family protein [Jhaorihella thermophila]SEF48541.1 stage IV sporulation protein FB [Jhaorihella thermophila]